MVDASYVLKTLFAESKGIDRKEESPMCFRLLGPSSAQPIMVVWTSFNLEIILKFIHKMRV